MTFPLLQWKSDNSTNVHNERTTRVQKQCLVYQLQIQKHYGKTKIVRLLLHTKTISRFASIPPHLCSKKY